MKSEASIKTRQVLPDYNADDLVFLAPSQSQFLNNNAPTRKQKEETILLWESISLDNYSTWMRIIMI